MTSDLEVEIKHFHGHKDTRQKIKKKEKKVARQ